MKVHASVPSTPNMAGQEQLQGEVERLVYSSGESGFTICRLRVPGRDELVTVVGPMPGVQPGERLLVRGRWVDHPRHGYQFQADSYRSLLPAGANAIRRYLASGLVRGIGPVLAGRLVDRFGEETLQVIQEQPERLTEAPGVGPRRVASIERAWAEQREIRNVMLFLQGYGVSAAYATRIYRTYGQDAVRVVKENPYRLAQDVRGIGFVTADSIAREMGIDEHSSFRAQAALEHLLQEQTGEGHVFARVAELTDACRRRFDLPRELIEDAVGRLEGAGRIMREGEAVFLRGLYLAERAAADAIKALAASPMHRREFDASAAVAWANRRMGVALTGEQEQAVHGAVTQKVFVVTGGPGTGKTTILRAVLSILTALRQRVVLAAPTGRAAKRLGEAAGHEAQTLHRLLEFRPGEGRFGRNAEHPLEADAVVVDETSMLTYCCATASCRPCRVTHRCSSPEMRTSCRPWDRERSWETSSNQGRYPSFILNGYSVREIAAARRGGSSDQPGSAAESCRGRLTGRLLHRRGGRTRGCGRYRRPALCRKDTGAVRAAPHEGRPGAVPMNRGTVGTRQLSDRLREALNPCGVEVTRFGRTFRTGDRVLQSVNNYGKDVFNGDQGGITEVDVVAGRITVVFDETHVDYDFSELDELQPSYSMTVHRAQGSEWPAVVVPVMTQHYPMLQRNLLYTAVTRGRKLVVVVGSRRALAIAARNDRPRERNTMLQARLQPCDPQAM